MNVFVTGSSSCLAQAVLPALCAEPGIERVTGADLAPFFDAAPWIASRALLLAGVLLVSLLILRRRR